jgi:hypothetical protein
MILDIFEMNQVIIRLLYILVKRFGLLGDGYCLK